MKDEYVPISCSFYDRLEAVITLKKEVLLSFYQEGKLINIRTSLVDLVTRDKLEFCILADGTEIRLDHIKALDGILLKDSC